MILQLRSINLDAQMNQVPEPRRSQLESLRLWLIDHEGGNNFQSGVEQGTYLSEEGIQPSLYLTVNPSLPEDDMFTNLVMDVISGPFHRTIGEKLGTGEVIDEESRYVSYQDSTISKMSNVIVTVIASVLPPLTVLALNSLPTTISRIGLTVVFTALFAGILGCFSTAKRAEILVATAT